MNNLIGITGSKGSGKDTVAKIINLLSIDKSDKATYQYIIENNPYLPVSCKYKVKRFAGPLKRFVADILGVPIEKLESRQYKEKELGEEWDYLTPRKLLQLIGTNVGRQVHRNIWVNALFKDYKNPVQIAIEQTGGYTNHPDPLNFPNWIIPDVRFDNEAKAVKDRGGIIIRVNKNINNTDTHASEAGISDNLVNIEIDNSGTIQDLIIEVKNKAGKLLF